MHGRQHPDKAAEGMAVHKDGGLCQADTDTARTGCGRERHNAGKKIKEQPCPVEEVRLQHPPAGHAGRGMFGDHDRGDG